jgi:hypothetical protein
MGTTTTDTKEVGEVIDKAGDEELVPRYARIGFYVDGHGELVPFDADVQKEFEAMIRETMAKGQRRRSPSLG